MNKIFKFDRIKAIDLLKLTPNDVVLEIGVGTGLNLQYYPAQVKLFGVDFSESMLNKARKKSYVAQVELQLADAVFLPYPDNYFDKCLATFVLRVSTNPKKVLQEISRVVTSDGLFVVVDKFKKDNSKIYVLNRLSFILGWGQDYDIDELITKTSWVIFKTEKINNTQFIILKNKKNLYEKNN